MSSSVPITPQFSHEQQGCHSLLWEDTRTSRCPVTTMHARNLACSVNCFLGKCAFVPTLCRFVPGTENTMENQSWTHEVHTVSGDEHRLCNLHNWVEVLVFSTINGTSNTSFIGNCEIWEIIHITWPPCPLPLLAALCPPSFDSISANFNQFPDF